MYVELTTLKQSLVRRKNRKLRRLRELYPDIRVKLFYGKDFRALMLKYGRFDLAASLSGLEGQVAADRANSQVKLSLVVPPPSAGQESLAAVGDAKIGSVPGPIATSRHRLSRGSRRRRGRRTFRAARAVA